MPSDRGDFRRDTIHQLFNCGIQRLNRKQKQHQHRKDEKMRKGRADEQEESQPDAEGENFMPKSRFLPQPPQPLHGVARGGKRCRQPFSFAEGGLDCFSCGVASIFDLNG